MTNVSDLSWDSLVALNEKDQQQYSPDQQEVIQYAEYLGLEMPTDADLLYIVKQGLNALLPKQWEACHTQDGELVYRNTVTRKIQQQHPLDQHYKKKIANIKKLRLPMSIIQQEKNQSKHSQTYSKGKVVITDIDKYITQEKNLQSEQQSIDLNSHNNYSLKKGKQQLIKGKRKSTNKSQKQYKKQQWISQSQQSIQIINQIRIQSLEKEIIAKQQVLKSLQHQNKMKIEEIKKFIKKKVKKKSDRG